MTDAPTCPACGGTRQWFPEDGGVIVHADNGCPLCDLAGRSWGGVLEGDVLTRLAELREGSVSCVVTSPPYWSLRKYDAPDVTWPGSDPACDHKLEGAPPPKRDRQHLKELGERDGSGGGKKHSTGEQYSGVAGGYTGSRRWQHEGVSRQETPDAWVAQPGDSRGGSGPGAKEEGNQYARAEPKGATCSRCGAWRGQFGLEPTRELYIEHSMMVLRALRRVLRKDGVIWWNLDDARGHRTLCHDLIPERFLLAAEADGWLVCSKNVWEKPNAMPESAKRRPTDAHENVFMLAKHPSYWYDQEAVREAYTESTIGRFSQSTLMEQQGGAKQADPLGPYQGGGNANKAHKIAQSLANHPNQGRNLRSVWTFPTAQTPEAHFATFPPELPRRCIEAACPREVCAKCGTARVRLVETGERTEDLGSHAWTHSKDDGDPTSGPARRRATGVLPNHHYDTRTTGWSDCPCPEPDYQPGIVLDPFAGVGTTLYVARQLGRRFIGIELSETYAQMARDKLATWWAPGNLAPRPAPAGQGALL